ncbi:MAG: thiolase family protein [Alphaproteobacteria bacterium]|nr:thiolase family protein [Alphaproteobacteria bacterium]
MTHKAEIPYGAYWSTPFARWQGSLSHLNSIEFAGHVAKEELKARDISVDDFDYGVLGMTVPQQHSFYGLPWLTKMIGAEHVGGPTIGQACATSARCLQAATQEIDAEMASTALVMTADRVSNGPQITYPDPSGVGGLGRQENWTLDNMNHDPLGGPTMTGTAENVARKYQFTTEMQHEVVLRRYEQYQDATKDDHAFQKRYMRLPFEVPDKRYRKTIATMQGDEGITASTKEGLAKLRPVLEDGTVTYGGQTHPADGNTAMVVTTPDKAEELSSDRSIRITIHGFGQHRTEPAFMPQATVGAAAAALAQADMDWSRIDAVKTHNPFAVNDLVLAHESGFDIDKMNNYGCSLIWGHPQGPTGLRAIVELIEELALRGGGIGLFGGCAAGDSAMAVVLEVADR